MKQFVVNYVRATMWLPTDVNLHEVIWDDDGEMQQPSAPRNPARGTGPLEMGTKTTPRQKPARAKRFPLSRLRRLARGAQRQENANRAGAKTHGR